MNLWLPEYEPDETTSTPLSYEQTREGLRLLRVYSARYLGIERASFIDEDEVPPFSDFLRDNGQDAFADWLAEPNHPFVSYENDERDNASR